MWRTYLFYGALLVVLPGLAVQAQEPAFMEAATHPGRSAFYTRVLASYAAYDLHGIRVDDYRVTSKSAYGLHPRLAFLFDAEARRIESESANETGLDTVTVRLKYRYLQLDLGPINTIRASATAGGMVPGGRKLNPNRNVSPRLGTAITAILGRHGLNGQIDHKFLSDRSDETEVNASHLYRMAPARYTRDTKGAWYTMLESINSFFGNGEYRVDVAAGILYEARSWAAEAAVRFPIAEKGSHDSVGAAIVGYRHLF